jgi:two-component system NtrC family response regulator
VTRNPRVLLVDDDESFRRVHEYQLAQAGYEVTSAADGEAALTRFRDERPDVVISDVKMPGLDGLALLARITAMAPDTPVVMITAQGTVETAVEAMKRGAFDFLTKPFPGEKLRLTLERARELARLRRENRELRREVEGRRGVGGLIGSSPAMQRLFEAMELVAPAPSTVLIQGETGTGKELVARALHHDSPRKDAAFVTVNCGAIPESLIESELFGHRKGAFTGAGSDRMGKFEAADGGTLLLDEVGEIPLALQSKILRVLQSGEVDRLGSDRPIGVDVRILAATNRDLESMVQSGDFREDLYYRLAVVPLGVPPLRERREDIPLLAEHFLRRMRERTGRSGLCLPAEALSMFERYAWPGNVRELENTIERMVVLSRDDELSIDTMPEKVRGFVDDARTTGFKLPPGGVRLDELERDLLVQALRRHDGNRTKAAKELGLTRNTLLYRMQKHGLR